MMRILVLVVVLAAGGADAEMDTMAAGEETDTASSPALPSALATRSLLLDVAHAGDRLVAVGQWGHVVLSDDRGETWRQAQFVPRRTTLTAVHFADAKHGWAVGHDAVVLHSEDGGETWEVQYEAPELESPLLSIWVGESGRGLAVGAFSLMLETDDGGKQWTRGAAPGGEDTDRHLNAVFRGPADTLWIAAESGHVYRSRDDGRSWAALAPPYSGSFWNGLELPGGAVLVFGLRGHAFRSDDVGATWSRVETGTDKSLTGGVVLGPERVVLVGLGGVVLSSHDGGNTFALRTRPHRRSLTAVAAGPPGELVLFGEEGVEHIEE
jgi:photosystem II stability/assembly factor-like uncharacterized protein